ncbi:hypothetical protein BD779DRAFT_1472066 [Infundibulicybe gibba]|nr:hypothetical protein BD779DRAFT_1472066 [Infundibulicybe gibba]
MPVKWLAMTTTILTSHHTTLGGAGIHVQWAPALPGLCRCWLGQVESFHAAGVADPGMIFSALYTTMRLGTGDLDSVHAQEEGPAVPNVKEFRCWAGIPTLCT